MEFDLYTDPARLRASVAGLAAAVSDLDRRLHRLGGSRATKGIGPFRLVDPADDPAAVSAKQTARARRRRGAPRSHIRTRIARGDMPPPRYPSPHEYDRLPREVRANPRLPRSALDVLAAILQLHGRAEAEGWHAETFIASIATMAMLCPRRVRDLLDLLRAEGLITTERLPGLSYRHRRLRITPTEKARPAPAPRRPPPPVIALAYRLLATSARTGTLREAAQARDALARFYRHGRFVEDLRHMQQRARIESASLIDSRAAGSLTNKSASSGCGPPLRS